MGTNDMQWKSAVAGFSGGFVSTAVLHPFDLLKIRFEVNEKSVESQRIGRPQYTSVTPGLIGSSVAWSSYFFLYDTMKRLRMNQLAREKVDRQLNSYEFIAAAIFGGMLTITVTNPIWVIKTQMCLDYNKKMDMRNTIKSIYRNNGFKKFYSGLLPAYIGTSHGAIQFVIYEKFKNHKDTFIKYFQQYLHSHVTEFMFFTFTSTSSKLFATMVTYPYQVIRVRLQDQHREYANARDVMKSLFYKEGVFAFYKGVIPAILRVLPQSMITFLTYEYIMKLGSS
ncbi:hypothetical protein SNEBB_010790 [Seison nebaliae]|nr:hypothetical protein SNEBB_010790 [Seison nebaliae]